MKEYKFRLTTDQLELLLAFENTNGLSDLSEHMGRDASVVSRGLQRIAEESDVIKKVKGRWQITPLGSQVNARTRSYLEEMEKLITFRSSSGSTKTDLTFSDSTLIIINAQKALLNSSLEGRNNSEALQNIENILKHWRLKRRQVIHVKHVSENLTSTFYRESTGCDFFDELRPSEKEVVLEKFNSSAFSGTALDSILQDTECSKITIVGFTANECIDATARDAQSLGYSAYVVNDATATFDLRDLSGKLVKADRIHRITMININALYAKVVNTEEILT